jgi:nucleoside-diphosphate-sugar epimerase
MKLLLTGADGYIGSYLAPYLESKGYDVHKYDGDIRQFDISSYSLPDYVIHLAAMTGVRASWNNPKEYFDVNVLGTREVFLECRTYGVPVIFASSSNAKEVNNPYAETKFLNEVDMSPESIGFRPHTVYPGRQDMLFQSLRRGDVTYINGGHYRDFTHIDDLCSGVFTIIQNYGKLKGKVVDIGSGNPVSVIGVAKAMGYTGEVVYKETPGERTITDADLTELTELGWKPTKDIFEEINALCNSK